MTMWQYKEKNEKRQGSSAVLGGQRGGLPGVLCVCVCVPVLYARADTGLFGGSMLFILLASSG